MLDVRDDPELDKIHKPCQGDLSWSEGKQEIYRSAARPVHILKTTGMMTTVATEQLLETLWDFQIIATEQILDTLWDYQISITLLNNLQLLDKSFHPVLQIVR